MQFWTFCISFINWIIQYKFYFEYLVQFWIIDFLIGNVTYVFDDFSSIDNFITSLEETTKSNQSNIQTKEEDLHTWMQTQNNLNTDTGKKEIVNIFRLLVMQLKTLALKMLNNILENSIIQLTMLEKLLIYHHLLMKQLI